jgi:hypothetical protein
MLERKFIYFIGFFLLLFIFSGCSNDKEKKSERQVPEVLLASDCGFDKMKCCTSTPICNYGQQCCVNSNNSSQNYCSENCHCGDNDEFCCAGNVCTGSAVCVNGVCSSCGGKNQSCCQSGEGCSPGLVCQNDRCRECGGDGQFCCAGENACLAKEGERVECLNSVCVSCGFDGHQPCSTGDKCLAGQVFAGTTCERCGGVNQPCCEKSHGIYCDESLDLECHLGFCSPK